MAEGMLWIGSWDHNIYCIGEADPLTGIEMVWVMEPREENMSVDENFTLRGFFIGRALGSTVSWHYSPDRNESNAQIIFSAPILEGKPVYDWDTSDIPEGMYYIMGKLESGNVTLRDWSEGPIRIQHEDDGEDEFIPMGGGVPELVLLFAISILVKKKKR